MYLNANRRRLFEMLHDPGLVHRCPPSTKKDVDSATLGRQGPFAHTEVLDIPPVCRHHRWSWELPVTMHLHAIPTALGVIFSSPRSSSEERCILNHLYVCMQPSLCHGRSPLKGTLPRSVSECPLAQEPKEANACLNRVNRSRDLGCG